MGRDEFLRLLREDPEVQGAVLAILAGAINAPAPAPDATPVSQAAKPKPQWVRDALEAQGKS